MSITPSTLSRLALFLESNTFPPSLVSVYTLVPHQELYLRQLSRMRSYVCCKVRGNSFFHYTWCVLSIPVQGVGGTSPGSFACPSSGRNRALVFRSNGCRGTLDKLQTRSFTDAHGPSRPADPAPSRPAGHLGRRRKQRLLRLLRHGDR